MTLFQAIEEAKRLQSVGYDEAQVIIYASNLAPFVQHTVVCRNDKEFKELKDSYKGWDFSFNKVII